VPAFAYHAIDGSGSRRAGRATATTSRTLIDLLEAEGLVVVSVRPTEGAAQPSAPFTRRNQKSLIDITRAMAGLLSAGLPLSRALTATESMTTESCRERLRHVRQAVTRGEPLAAAMAAHPDLFPPFYIGLVQAGERAADLPGAFTRLAGQLEREDELRSRLVSAAIYPTLLAVVGTAAVLILMLFVMPRFATVLEGAGARLPRSTQLLIEVGASARRCWYLFLLPVIAVPLFAAWVTRTEEGAHAWAKALLAVPGLGTLRRDLAGARFARMMSVLLAGGAPIVFALESAAGTLVDPLARAELGRIRARVREGGRLASAVAGSMLFPPLLAQLAALGEETGQLHEFLRKAADLFEQSTERSLARLVALAEPTMIVLLAIIVGSVALSLLQAIYGVNASAFR
jgi:general secretion pathway protein F